MTEQDYIDISSEIESLKASKALTSSFEEEMEFADKIHNLQLNLDGVKPQDTFVDCIGCGS